MSQQAINKKRSEKTLGGKATATEIKQLLELFAKLTIKNWQTAVDKNRKPKLNVFTIWGKHGIGKTELVNAIAEENGWLFSQVNIGEFEEMGDLHGIPKAEGDVTVTCRPDWVPVVEPPEGKVGVFFLDDVNRADDRILRGIMRLMQDGGMASWSLPRNWMIVCTANPEGGEYSVTPQDDAMKTRQTHVTMEFDLAQWQAWAVSKGNVDQRFVYFTSQYEELAKQGCPRSYVKCAEQLAEIEDWNKDLGLVSLLVRGNLTDEIASEFLKYIASGMIELISPNDIINMTKEQMDIKINKFLKDCTDTKTGTIRKIGPLNVILTRLIYKLEDMSKSKELLTKEQGVNIARFLMSPSIDNDLRKSNIETLTKSKSITVSELNKITMATVEGAPHKNIMTALIHWMK